MLPGPRLADEFYVELRSFFQKTADAPEVFSIRERDLRRVNLERFPIISFFNSRGSCANSDSSSSQSKTVAWDSST